MSFCLVILASATVAEADLAGPILKDSIETVRRAGPGGDGSDAAAKAWRQLAAAGLDDLPALLAGMDGASPLARNWLRSAIDRGMTFMDNCWDYMDGKCEIWMGKALRDGYRQKVFLMTKFDALTKAATMKQIDESLQRLQTDHVDLMQFHENIRMEDPDRFFNDGVVDALLDAKKAGKLR